MGMGSSAQFGAMSLMGTGFGMVNSAIGAYQQAGVQRANLQAQSAIQDANAHIAELAAQGSLEQGQRNEQNILNQAARLKGTQRAAMASNGLDLGYGTAAQLQASTDYMGKLDAATANANAVRQAWGYRTQAANAAGASLMAQASMPSQGAAVANTFLGSATSVASQWYGMKKDGTWDQVVSGFKDGSIWRANP